MRGPPHLVLRVDERLDVDDAQLTKHLAIRTMRHSGSEHQLPVAGRELRVVSAESGPMTCNEQLVVPSELDKRVVPVEQDGLDQRPARVTTWRGGSSGHRSP